MDPNIYFAYLCLLDHQGSVREKFKKWRTQLNSSGSYDITYRHLKREIQDICYTKLVMYKAMHIYEAEKIWSYFSVSKFISFLEEFGFKR